MDCIRRFLTGAVCAAVTLLGCLPNEAGPNESDLGSDESSLSYDANGVAAHDFIWHGNVSVSGARTFGGSRSGFPTGTYSATIVYLPRDGRVHARWSTWFTGGPSIPFTIASAGGGFITRSGADLLLDGQQYRFAGARCDGAIGNMLLTESPGIDTP